MDYIKHLKKDKKFAGIISGPVHERIKPHKNIPLQLIGNIMSQQLNTKVAGIIYKRFLALYNNKEPKPQQVVDTPTETLRSIGLSNAKVKYVHNVASFCIEQKITDKKLLALSDQEIITLLTQIKGVGKWTVEMLLMFALGREDIFSADDLGIQQAMIKIYSLKTTDKKKMRERMIKLSKSWSPYRTYACLYLWAWKDEK
jgi:DNA-3-methyladenine glycosylase II